jgi:N6-adenosine-specific RNA methylase IME4
MTSRAALREGRPPFFRSGMTSGTSLTKYDAACRALAEAIAVDEVVAIRDEAAQLAAAARVANNHQAEADAVAIRMRATRRLGQLMQAQKESVGFNQGAAGGGKKNGPRGSLVNPRDLRPTLASQGIDKHLAHQARVLSAPSEADFEELVADAHDKVARAVRNTVREIEIEQERETYRARTYQGGTVASLEALVASGFSAGVIYADPPWTFHTYSGKGKQRSAERHFDVMSLDDIKALPIGTLAAANCTLLLWSVWPELPGALDVIAAWGFQYQTAGFVWVKQNASGDGVFTGMGYHTRANTEPCLLATRGSPLRLAADVHQVVMTPVGEHSEKPEEVARRVERLYPGPYLELFARKPRDGWTTWGNEIAPPDPLDIPPCLRRTAP